MFELSTTTALMLYLVVTLAPLFALWGYQHFQRRKYKVVVERNDLRVCEFCQFAYLGERGSSLSKCPQCHSFNKNSK